MAAPGEVQAPSLGALTDRQRYLALAAAFLGWMGAGMQMSAIPARPAALHFLNNGAAIPDGPGTVVVHSVADRGVLDHVAAAQGAIGPKKAPIPAVSVELEKQVGMWTAWYNASFLLGAALGGLLFGWAGDRIGRVKSLGLSILCYSCFTGVCSTVTSLEQLVALRFVAGLGVGGVWPTGVALAMEAWANRSRSLVAGVIGTAANVGLSLMAVVCAKKAIAIGGWSFDVGRNVAPGDWRWVMLVGATPAIVGVFVPFFVPESPTWRLGRTSSANHKIPLGVVFRRPYLSRTLIGIALGTVPLFGGWGSINWAVNWSDAVGQTVQNQALKADTQLMRSSGAILGSFCGGWLATAFGRRTTYFLICLGSLLTSGYLFWFLTPSSGMFLPWMFLTGFVATTAFGWLPLYLPELFPTEIRATGSGVTFNFGRIVTVLGVLGTGVLLSAFDGDYARSGRVTHLIFAVGMVMILFAPDTTKQARENAPRAGGSS